MRKSVKVSFTISPVLEKMVNDMAEGLGVSVSEAFRIVLVQGFEKLAEPGHPLGFAVFKGSSEKK